MEKPQFHESNTEIQVYRVSSIATRPFFCEVLKATSINQEHLAVADSKYNMGLLYTTRNEMDTARELCLECEKIYSEVHGPGHSKTVNAALLASQCVQESV